MPGNEHARERGEKGGSTDLERVELDVDVESELILDPSPGAVVLLVETHYEEGVKRVDDRVLRA